jgi:TDG/mug DNA glycosylase family protein
MLPDLLRHHLKLVVCGTAVGNTSAQLKQYYAGPSNKFWKTLFEIGLTPVLIAPSEYEKLLDYEIGLTDLVKGKSGMDHGLKTADFASKTLVEKIKQYQPKYLCFSSKRAAKEFFQRRTEYGLQPEKIGKTRIFVAPSTSAVANRWWNVHLWQELAKLWHILT